MSELNWRIASQLEKTPNGCIEWTGLTHDGYGRTFYKGKTWRLHRLMWTVMNGPIPKGLWVLHKCDNRKCVNLDHLKLGDHKENMKDLVERKRSYNKRKTKCVNGHDLNEENTRYNFRKSDGYLRRRCKTCDREQHRRNYVAKK